MCGLLRYPPLVLVHLCASVGPQGLLVVRLPALFVPHSSSLSPAMATRVLSAPVPISTPPTGLDVFLFYLLGVRLPCHSIFCQFWLCKEAQCVYLRCHLGSLSRTMKWHSSYTVINGLNIKFMCTYPGTFHHLKQYGEKRAVLREEDNSGLTLGLLNFLYFTFIFILEDQHCHDPL